MCPTNHRGRFGVLTIPVRASSRKLLEPWRSGSWVPSNWPPRCGAASSQPSTPCGPCWSAPPRSRASTRSRSGSTSGRSRRRPPPTRSSPSTRVDHSAACPLLSRIPITWRECRPRTAVRPSRRSRRPDRRRRRRLEAAGAVIFAKTTTPEFCYAGTTPGTHNPHDPSRTPGGSSGGAAVAVAAGAGPLALGGDGGGSIRIPAAFCGLVGFKPTFGAVPREPSAQGWKTLVAYGPLASTVADARLMFETLAGVDPHDRHPSPPSTLRGRTPQQSCSPAATSLGTVDDDVRARSGRCAPRWARWMIRRGCPTTLRRGRRSRPPRRGGRTRRRSRRPSSARTRGRSCRRATP